MKINKLKLLNFRNFLDKTFVFEEGINLITAQNGRGKTNILEAIRIMCYGKPIFGARETDAINFEVAKSNLPYTKILSSWEDNQSNFTNTYTLSPQIKPTKALTINNEKISQSKFVGQFSTVWFSPETINIITASPKYRRELLDMYFCQLDPIYASLLNDYNKAVESRGRLLKSKERGIIARYIDRYDAIVAHKACALIAVKQELATVLTMSVADHARRQTRYQINWLYEPSIRSHEIFDENLHKSILASLKDSREKDIFSKRTNIGPHRDDWTLELIDLQGQRDAYDLRKYGSRGQKRMGLLIFTLAIVSLLEKQRGSKPVLLLDDVVSELDDENIGLILQMLHQSDQQSIITSTHDQIPGIDKANVIKLMTN